MALLETVGTILNSVQEAAGVLGFARNERLIASFKPSLVIEESIDDSAEITQHPIEDGSMITDHVITKPITVSMHVYWGPDLLKGAKSINETYQKLIELKESGEPFTLVLGKRTLDNMLFTSIKNDTNRDSEYVLSLSLQFQQVIRVALKTVAISSPQGEHSSTQQAGKKQAEKVDNKATESGATDAATKNNSGLYDIFYG